jgi:hypothetical protein
MDINTDTDTDMDMFKDMDTDTDMDIGILRMYVLSQHCNYEICMKIDLSVITSPRNFTNETK